MNEKLPADRLVDEKLKGASQQQVAGWMQQVGRPQPSLAWKAEAREALKREAQGQRTMRVTRRRAWWLASGVTATASMAMLVAWLQWTNSPAASWEFSIEEALLEAHRESVLFQDAGAAPVLDEHFMERWTSGT